MLSLEQNNATIVLSLWEDSNMGTQFMVEQKIVANTKDESIRRVLTDALIRELQDNSIQNNYPVRVFSEFGVNHGEHRIDIVTVNGNIHGFEIKSDGDTLIRLPAQVQAFSKVFDKITLVVGESHIIDALFIIPDWWGVKLAKGMSNGSVILSDIRIAQDNPMKDMMSIARLLWKQEVLEVLESMNSAFGVKTKRREFVYERFVSLVDIETLQRIVLEKLFTRANWRVDQPLLQYGD